MPPPDVSDAEPNLSIGRLAEETGISIETLRKWESRYGYPTAHRLPSGHRRYSSEHVRRLRRVADGLALGHRPSKLLGLDDGQLDELIAGHASCVPENKDVHRLLESVRGYRRKALRAAMFRLAEKSPVLDFLTEIVAPLLDHVGHAWANGTLDVRHEHFATEVVADVLRSLRLGSEHSRPSEGRLVVLATLSGEKHDLGLQMAALCCSSAGVPFHILGPETPTREIVAAARELDASAVGLSVSLATGGPGTDRRIRELHDLLPESVRLIVGGAGARGVRRGPRGVVFPRDLYEFREWLEKKPPCTSDE